MTESNLGEGGFVSAYNSEVIPSNTEGRSQGRHGSRGRRVMLLADLFPHGLLVCFLIKLRTTYPRGVNY